MEFSLSEESQLIKDSAKKYLYEKWNISFLDDMKTHDPGYKKDIWDDIAGLGWLGLIYDEQHGGSNGNLFDLFLIFEQMGSVLLQSPFYCSGVIAGLILAASDDEKMKEEYLPRLISGEKIYSYGFLDETGAFDIKNPKIRVVAHDGNRASIVGGRGFVPYGDVADGIIVCADMALKEDICPTLIMLDRNSRNIEIENIENFSDERHAAIHIGKGEVPDHNIIGPIGNGLEIIKKMLPKAIVLNCAEIIGAMDAMTRLTVQYVKDREQFGAPLGKLQVVQHHCADMLKLYQTSKLIAYQSAWLVSRGLPSDKEVAMAKAWCGEAYVKSAFIAQQLHGAMGFTEEYHLHHFFKHAKKSELIFDDAFYYRKQISDILGL